MEYRRVKLREIADTVYYRHASELGGFTLYPASNSACEKAASGKSSATADCWPKTKLTTFERSVVYNRCARDFRDGFVRRERDETSLVAQESKPPGGAQ